MSSARPADQDVYDLPWDPETRDVVCRRDEVVRLPDDGSIPISAFGELPTRTTLHYNIERQHIDHSPAGWEWGYGGSGPSDYALNILASFIGPAPDCGPVPEEDDERELSAEEFAAETRAWEAWADCDDQRVKLHDGTYVHRDVYRLLHDFKFEFVATLPREGGTIRGDDIRAWIVAHRGQGDDYPDENTVTAAGRDSY